MPDLPKTNNEANAWPLVIVLAGWAIIVILSLVAYQPVRVKPASAPANEFSAARAEPILEFLIGDSIPHPTGSEQNTIVRTRLIELLESYGYNVEIQSGTGTIDPRAKSRSPDRDVVDLHNLIVRRSEPADSDLKSDRYSERPILLVAHYDSTPSGPGAGDDGIGMSAVVEIARMLALDPSTQREVVFLLTDGEELGLLGAKLFCAQHPLAKKIGVVINLEARGTSGPSMMFETSPMTRTLIPIFANSSPRPFASSLFYEIYRRLPNDTDFTIFNRAGVAGYNFAIIGDVRNYHTPQDNFQTVDRASFQHHGENALALIRTLSRSPSVDRLLSDTNTKRPVGGPMDHDEVVYFDLFGRFVVWWPRACSLWMCLAAGIMLMAGIVREFRRLDFSEMKSKNRWWPNMVASIMTIVGVSAIIYSLQICVRFDPRLSNPWPRFPVPIVLGYWSVSFAVTAGIAFAFRRSLTPARIFLSVIGLWWMVAIASSWWFTGASFLFVVPIAIGASSMLIAKFVSRERTALAAIAFALAVGLIWLPLERLFYDAVGFRMPIAMILRMSVVCSALFCVLTPAGEKLKFSLALSLAIFAAMSFGVAIWRNSENTNNVVKTENSMIRVGETQWLAAGLMPNTSTSTPGE